MDPILAFAKNSGALIKNAIYPQMAKAKVIAWHKNAIGYFLCKGGDVQNANQTALLSSVYSNGCGFYVTSENLWQAAIMFTVRRVIKPTWLNDRDQFLQPTAPLTNEFKTDCLIWMLFNGSNLSASANDLEWNGKKWSIVNHFIPYTEAEVNASGRFESDFMVQYLDTLRRPKEVPVVQAQGERDGSLSTEDQAMECVGSPTQAATNRCTPNGLSIEAQTVLDAGLVLWQAYFAHTDTRTVREELKLNRADVGWYQIRNALKARNASGDFVPVDFGAFETAYKALSDKLRPQVYELGFLR